jgi:hypothetical protein
MPCPRTGKVKFERKRKSHQWTGWEWRNEKSERMRMCWTGKEDERFKLCLSCWILVLNLEEGRWEMRGREMYSHKRGERRLVKELKDCLQFKKWKNTIKINLMTEI